LDWQAGEAKRFIVGMSLASLELVRCLADRFDWQSFPRVDKRDYDAAHISHEWVIDIDG
jgi:hypothetical protein